MRRLLAALFLCFIFVGLTCARSQKSDREDEGLRGKVKSVVAENAKLSNESGRLIEGKRVPSSTVTYDASGNLLRQIFNRADGSVHFTIRHGFVDGDRTSTIKFEDDDSGPPAPPAPASSSNEGNARPADPRFDTKYKYKHDAQGNRVEEARYGSSGSLSITDVSRFDSQGRRIEWARHTADGKLNFRKTVVYDDRGQEAEVTYFRADGSVSDKYSYTGYEVDSQGNWVKRVASKGVTKGGKSFFEPYQVTYRKITYY